MPSATGGVPGADGVVIDSKIRGQNAPLRRPVAPATDDPLSSLSGLPHRSGDPSSGSAMVDVARRICSGPPGGGQVPAA